MNGRLMTTDLLDERGTRDIRAAQLGHDDVERHRAAKQQRVSRVGRGVDAKALTLHHPGDDGAEVRVGVDEKYPPALFGRACRRKLVGHESHTVNRG